MNLLGYTECWEVLEWLHKWRPLAVLPSKGLNQLQHTRNVQVMWCNCYNARNGVEVEVTLRLTVSPSVNQSVCLGVGHPFGAHDQIFLFPFFCRKIALPFVLGRPLWREDGSAICSAICQWSEPRRTHNHTVLSHPRLLGSLSVASYDSQGWRWKYSSLSDERTGL
jgi:hypothetical protein